MSHRLAACPFIDPELTGEGVKSHKLSLGICAVLAITLACAISARASSVPDSLEFEAGEVVLGLFNVNPGSCKDTIVGRRTRDGQVAPVRIDWGVCDTSQTRRSGGSTRIHLPQWNGLRFSVSMQDLNGDSLVDLIFFSSGKPEGRTRRSDSLRAVVVFGQSGLDTLRQIAVSSIGAGLQSRPFYALELEPGTHLQLPQRRDIIGRTSFLLVRLSSDASDSSRVPDRTSIDSAGVILTVTPNPASSSASIAAAGLQAARYSVRLVAVNGSSYHENSIEVGGSGRLADIIDLSTVPTGYYFVVLEVDGMRRASYPIVIVH
jgi:hypothetical protein